MQSRSTAPHRAGAWGESFAITTRVRRSPGSKSELDEGEAVAEKSENEVDRNDAEDRVNASSESEGDYEKEAAAERPASLGHASGVGLPGRRGGQERGRAERSDDGEADSTDEMTKTPREKLDSEGPADDEGADATSGEEEALSFDFSISIDGPAHTGHTGAGDNADDGLQRRPPVRARQQSRHPRRRLRRAAETASCAPSKDTNRSEVSAEEPRRSKGGRREKGSGMLRLFCRRKKRRSPGQSAGPGYRPASAGRRDAASSADEEDDPVVPVTGGRRAGAFEGDATGDERVVARGSRRKMRFWSLRRSKKRLT